MILLKKYLVKHILYTIYRIAYTKIFWQFPYLLPTVKYPYIIGLELTNDCNLECIHCFRNKMNRDIGYMDFKVFKKLIDEISTYPFALLRIVGRGEPALHPELKKMMEYLKDKSIKVEFCTNGVLFENHSNKEILDWNIDMLDISVDGIDKESYNKLRKNGDYDRLEKNIVDFYNTRNNFKKTTPKINIRNVRFSNVSQNQIEEFKKRFGDFSDLVTFNVHNPINNSFKSFEKYSRCETIFFSSIIRWDGRVAKCAQQGIYEEESYIGDLRKETLKEIWKNPQLIELRLSHYKQDFSNVPHCKFCFSVHNKTTYNSIIILPK